ncbi:MAG: hypothetical protein MZV70_36005 [Desulfobacterales bacterium]|nr:hypothetical protein [Desulfobacterales bacterium]
MSDYGLFYRSWKNKIFNYLMRMTGDGSLAGDIMQETFARHFDHYGEGNRDIPLLYRDCPQPLHGRDAEVENTACAG